jgi:hypothetical protein
MAMDSRGRYPSLIFTIKLSSPLAPISITGTSETQKELQFGAI